MKGIKIIALFILLSPAFKFANAQDLEWVQVANFPAAPRYETIAFELNGKAYAGTGANFTLTPQLYKDFWEYDPTTNIWSQKADFPSTPRYGCVAFAIGNYGYVGTGWDPSQKADFYRYDPVSNSWNPIANFIGAGRYDATAMSNSTSGYLGFGYSPNDWYEYDPITNAWSAKANLPASARQSTSGFVIGNNIYIACGGTAGGSYFNDLWEYNPIANTWTQKSNFPGAPRYASYHFTMCGKGIVGGGGSSSSLFSDYLAYNPVSNSWSSLPTFPGNLYLKGSSFSISEKGYVGFGRNLSSVYSNEIWKLQKIKPTINAVQGPCDTTVQFSMSQSGSNTSYVWLFGDGSSASSLNPSHSYANGTYTVSLISTYECISDTSFISVTIPNPTPVSSSFNTQIDSCNFTISFTAADSTQNHLWLFGNGSSSNLPNPVYTYSGAGNYTITHIVSNQCYSDSTAVTLNVPNAFEDQIFIPNAFSPNNDLKNDVFEFVNRSNCIEFTIDIFNRWGQHIYSGNQDNFSWDGTYQKKACSEGIYPYIIRFNKSYRSGFVTLFR